MKVHTTPCSVQCPANTDIPAYMERLRQGDVEGAAHILMEANPIPMITSRVCAHTCQEQCNRCGSDESVSIHGVERYVGDYILEHPDTFYRAPETETGHKVALVGAGPAGLSAAYYLRKAGHDVTVFDKMEEPGGMLTYAIPNYRLPKSYVKQVAAAYEKWESVSAWAAVWERICRQRIWRRSMTMCSMPPAPGNVLCWDLTARSSRSSASSS